MNDVASEISNWFVEHDAGDFVQLPVTHPYSVTVPSAATRCVLYTTKPASVLHALEQRGGLASMQVVGRAGLPDENDAQWLRTIAGDRVVVFLGDADPVDLLIFVWLRSQMPVSYVGVNDRLIQKLGVRVEDFMTISLADDEKAAISLLASLCPDYRTVVGPQCAALLDRGRKIEIEAVVNFAPGSVSLEDAINQQRSSTPA